MLFAIDVIKFILAVKNVLIHDVRPLNVSCSAVRCGQWCALDNNCVAFLYDYDSGSCYTHPDVYTSLMKDQFKKTGGLMLYLDSKVIRDSDMKCCCSDWRGFVVHFSSCWCGYTISAQVCRAQGRHYSRPTGKCSAVDSNEADKRPVPNSNPKAIQCRRRGYSYWDRGDICYKKMSKVTVWNTAINDCRVLNSTMFNVDSDIKHEFYVKVVAKQTNRRKSLLGTRRIDCQTVISCDGPWGWAGKPLTSFRWHDGFPKNWYTSNCVQYTWKDNKYLWENVACYTARPYYCHIRID